MIEGLGVGMNFIHEAEYYTPSSIGSWPKAEERLRSEYSIQEDKQLLGFELPKEKGSYQLKFLLPTSEQFDGIEAGFLYYVHVEEKFGKDLSWERATD